MKRYVGEFKDFINKGDVITIAVGLVMALYFQKIVTAILDGVINPLIAAIFGEQNFADIGFYINESFISIGLVIDAVITFIVVAFFLFLVIKAYNNMKKPTAAETNTKECPFCLSTIPAGATRCPNCTSELTKTA
jgi:large conductance mechanosensitive channel